MDWWIWLIIGVAILALASIAVLVVQARRRAGGVIADGTAHAGRRGKCPR